MKKPEKKGHIGGDLEKAWDNGYNQAIDDYEKFLPSEEEIVEILKNKGSYVAIDKTMQQELGGFIKKWSRRELAKAIHKRLGGK